MDKLEHYRQCIQKILAERGNAKIQNGEVESELIFAVVRDRYLWMR
jgi:XisI protein